MADEYIKRKDVLECIKESRDGIDWGQSEDGDAFLHYSACLYRTIASNECFPSADVAEVVHGRWLWELADNGWADHICSKCGYTINTDVHVIVDYNYCANCGARMNGE